jgi:N-terminal acetyltransferase B complex catalytic subunit
MTTTRRFCCDDLLRFSTTNLDPLTETYNVSFYLLYLTRWPSLCSMQESSSGRVSSYMIGKAEGHGREWHGHVSALTVAPEFRRLGLAKTLMAELERVSEKE